MVPFWLEGQGDLVSKIRDGIAGLVLLFGLQGDVYSRKAPRILSWANSDQEGLHEGCGDNGGFGNYSLGVGTEVWTCLGCRLRGSGSQGCKRVSRSRGV